MAVPRQHISYEDRIGSEPFHEQFDGLGEAYSRFMDAGSYEDRGNARREKLFERRYAVGSQVNEARDKERAKRNSVKGEAQVRDLYSSSIDRLAPKLNSQHAP